MEVQSCKIKDSTFCIWIKNNIVDMQDMSHSHVILISRSHLKWFENAIKDLLQQPLSEYFKEKFRDISGSLLLTKFRTASGWFTRVVWPLWEEEVSFMYH